MSEYKAESLYKKALQFSKFYLVVYYCFREMIFLNFDTYNRLF